MIFRRSIVLSLFLCLIVVLVGGIPGPAHAQDGHIRQLVGPVWTRVATLDGKGAIPDGVGQTIVFRDDGGISGSTGCNGYGGKGELTGGKFALSPLRMSRRACFDDVQAMEADFMQRLTASSQWWLRGGELYLADPGGTPLLRFVRP